MFRVGLQSYLRLDTLGMARDTLIKHKEAIMIYEKNKLVKTNCNTLITHPESKLVAQLVVIYTTIKQQLTYSNCGKIGHVKETYHNKKKEEHVVPSTSTKVDELIVGVITQPIKPTRVPLKYPYIICSNFEHCALDCPKKT